MKLWSVFRKSLREQSRDLLGLSLTLVFAPLFVLLYWLLFPSGSTTYEVLVINRDAGATQTSGAHWAGGEELIQALQSVTYKDGAPLIKVIPILDRAAAETSLKNRDAEVLLIIPEDFSRALQAAAAGQETEPAPIIFSGDLTNPYYAIAGVLASSAVDQYLRAAAGQPAPVPIVEEPLGGSAARTEFETYVPGLLVVATILLVFLAAMTVARDVESGALRRLQITRMTALDYLVGVCAALLLVGLGAELLTFLTAWALGFRSVGPMWVAVLVGALVSLATIGVGLLVACFSKTVTQAFLIANFPFALMMFFSGSAFPMPRVPLFTLGGRSIGLYDILPATHGVAALNKVLTLGAGLKDIAFEVSALLVLSILTLIAGAWLFQRIHLRA